MPSSIRVLPPDIVNRIAAGEVVERPSSVVKELVENALDADATEINVVLEEGGIKRILVRDNGHGMAQDDLQLAFISHATSKLDEAALDSGDLGAATLGFRGEALPSIASISDVEVISRVRQSDCAYRYRPTRDEIEPHAGEAGTSIEVRELFFNAPARRKFLRASATELSHCVQQVSRLAMAHPAVRFRLHHGRRAVLELPPVDNAGDRLRQIIPKTISDHLIEVFEGGDPQFPSLVGYVGQPRVHRRDTREQHFFVNGRWVRDRTLTHALRSAYQGFQIPGRQPVGYLFLDFPRGDVDANVHPTKTEVRLRDSSSVYRLVYHAVRKALEAADSEVVQDDEAKADDGPAYSVRELFAELTSTRGSKKDGRPESGEFDFSSRSGGVGEEEKSDADEGDFEAEDDATESSEARAEVDTGTTTLARGESEAATASAAGVQSDSATALEHDGVIQVLNSYLLAEVGSGVLFIDQHALHEIVLFEEIYRRIVGGVVERQRLLVPDVVDLSPADAPLVPRAAELLGRCGFELEAFGPHSVALHAVPAIFDREAGRTDVPALVRAVFDGLEKGVVPTATNQLVPDDELPVSVDVQLRDIAATIACKRAVKAGMPLSQTEIESLLARGGTAVDPRHCPHGRPTAVYYARRDIEKLFDRK